MHASQYGANQGQGVQGPWGAAPGNDGMPHMNKHMSMNSQPSIHSSNYSGQPYDAAGHANYGAYGAQHPPNNGQGPQVGPPNGQGHPPGPYGGPYNNMFDRQSSAASEYGAAASQHGAAPYGGPGGAHPPGYGAHPGAYGAAPVQPGAPYGTPAPYGLSLIHI